MLKKFVKLREGVYLGSARDMYIEDIAYLIGKGFALFWFDLREGKIVERGYYSRADLIFAAKNREDFISFLKRNSDCCMYATLEFIILIFMSKSKFQLLRQFYLLF